ncbi:MAG: nicotinamide mononucleotide (NMN) deamidase PncC, partial [Candidatus Nanohaloarchaea archaeon]
LYAVDIEGVPESFYDAVDTNYDPANVEAEAFVYNETLDEFKQVSDEVVNEILEGEL